MPRKPDSIPHATLRTGPEWPRAHRSGPNSSWTGWLTHREYDVLDMHMRLGVTNIFFYMSDRRGTLGCEGMFNELKNVGLIKGDKLNFEATDEAVDLFIKTDAYVMSYNEDEAA